MQREQLKTILDMMAKHGITSIVYDPLSTDPCVQIWSRHGKEASERDLEYWRPSRQEIEYYASEYDKCFGTTPRSED